MLQRRGGEASVGGREGRPPMRSNTRRGFPPAVDQSVRLTALDLHGFQKQPYLLIGVCTIRFTL